MGRTQAHDYLRAILDAIAVHGLLEWHPLNALVQILHGRQEIVPRLSEHRADLRNVVNKFARLLNSHDV